MAHENVEQIGAELATLVERMKEAVNELEILRQQWNEATLSLLSANENELGAARTSRNSLQEQIDDVMGRLDEANEMFASLLVR